MQLSLEQDRLDVRNKTRTNLFSWRGQFTPQLIEYLLTEHCKAGAVVADPFCGSGTVLLESARLGVECAGIEINPAAYVMSKFYELANLATAERLRYITDLEQKTTALIAPNGCLPLFSEGASYREQYKNLIDFARDFVEASQRGYERVLAVNALLLCEGFKGFDLGAAVLRALGYVRKALTSLSYAPRPITAYLRDARTLHEVCPEQIDVIVTSPPYINVFNYHQNYRAILEAIGWDLLTVAASEFGSNRKNRGNRFKTVIQYCLDLEQTIGSAWHSLRQDGLLLLVVGRESNVCGSPFYNGQILRDLVIQCGAFEHVSDRERVFTNKFGASIREDILVFRKAASASEKSIARGVAVCHLKRALNTAGVELGRAICDAIGAADTITPSPLFSPKRALRDA
ncbi:MAG TPA: DNA methyltransferase [Armatimonadota bacterium]|nr:DNA methyltransferase [Armatimonadota bacterium]